MKTVYKFVSTFLAAVSFRYWKMNHYKMRMAKIWLCPCLLDRLRTTQKCVSRKSRAGLSRRYVAQHCWQNILGHFFVVVLVNIVGLMCKCESLNRKLHQQSWWQFLVSPSWKIPYTLLWLTLITSTEPYSHSRSVQPPSPCSANYSFRPCQHPPPCVPSLQEQTENGFSTAGSAVIDDDNPAGFTSSTSAVRREGPLRTLDSHRPITVHFGQVGGNDKVWGGVGWGGDVVWCGGKYEERKSF